MIRTFPKGKLQLTSIHFLTGHTLITLMLNRRYYLIVGLGIATKETADIRLLELATGICIKERHGRLCRHYGVSMIVRMEL